MAKSKNNKVKEKIWTVQFNYEFGLDILTSHWLSFSDEEKMKKECEEWKMKNFNNTYHIYDGNYNPYDDEDDKHFRIFK